MDQAILESMVKGKGWKGNSLWMNSEEDAPDIPGPKHTTMLGACRPYFGNNGLRI